MDYDDPTPAGVIHETWRWFPAWVNALIIVFVSVAGLTVAGHYLGWWLSAQDTTHQAHIVQNNYNTQEGYLSAISNDVAQLDGIVAQEPGAPNQAALRAQAIGIGNQACLEATYLTGSTPVPSDMAAWIKANCDAGAVSLTSPIRKGGN